MRAIDRREFMRDAALLAGGAWLGSQWPRLGSCAEPAPREVLPVAAVITEYRKNSHADVIIGKILEGFDQQGGPGPQLKLVAMYTDQVPQNDLSRGLAEKHGFRIAETIPDALTLGTDRLAVAGVLCIGEHGNYPETPDTKQKMYPRRRLFDGVTDVFRKVGQVVPVFNDKHLAYAWADAKHMYDTARELKIPFLAGSSVPTAWRSPPGELPRDCDLKAAVGTGYSNLESYGFHALEGLQCLVERRKGGETGVASVQAVEGAAIGEAEKAGRWSRVLLDAAAAVSLVPKGGRPAEISDKAVFYLIEYRDGLQAAVAMNTGFAHQIAFAGRIAGSAQPWATSFRLQEGPPYGHFAHLLRAIDEMIHTGKPPYPVERTLLTTGMLDSLMHSHADGGKRIETPQLEIAYRPTEWPFAAGDPPA